MTNAFERQERVLEHAGFAFRIVSYKMASRWVAVADNINPGAVMVRAKGDTREAAEASAEEKARAMLQRTRSFDV